MKKVDTSTWPCNIARSTSIFGDHWNILLIRQACLGLRRFEDFQGTLGIGRNMLTRRLNGLVDSGIFDKVEYQSRPLRSEYRLTAKGRDAFTVLAAMDAWGRQWLAEAGSSSVTLRHLECGHDMHAIVVCSECSQPLDVRSVESIGST